MGNRHLSPFYFIVIFKMERSRKEDGFFLKSCSIISHKWSLFLGEEALVFCLRCCGKIPPAILTWFDAICHNNRWSFIFARCHIFRHIFLAFLRRPYFAEFAWFVGGGGSPHLQGSFCCISYRLWGPKRHYQLLSAASCSICFSQISPPNFTFDRPIKYLVW